MTERVFNFSPGPAVMPLSVLEQARDELVSLPGVGMSVMEVSHRGKTFESILESAETNLRQLLGMPEGYRVLFLQGGSRLQFSMVPMNLLGGKSADYVITGSWGKSALAEAKKQGDVRVVWDGKDTGYDRLPPAGELEFNPGAAYVHITSNETIEGVQFPGVVGQAASLPKTETATWQAGSLPYGDVPMVADFSSDFLCRPTPVDRYGLIYACAQKNAGPAGLTVVILREDLLQRSDDRLPGYMNYKVHAEANSMWNTPPTFAIYMFNLIGKWLINEIGGLAEMEKLNHRKAKLLYDAIDEGGEFYQPHAQVEARSLMNVTFRLPSDELQERFLAEAEQNNLMNLKGHRSVGGIRASIYNAQPLEGVEALAGFMRDFCEKNG